MAAECDLKAWGFDEVSRTRAAAPRRVMYSPARSVSPVSARRMRVPVHSAQFKTACACTRVALRQDRVLDHDVGQDGPASLVRSVGDAVCTDSDGRYLGRRKSCAVRMSRARGNLRRTIEQSPISPTDPRCGIDGDQRRACGWQHGRDVHWRIEDTTGRTISVLRHLTPDAGGWSLLHATPRVVAAASGSGPMPL